MSICRCIVSNQPRIPVWTANVAVLLPFDNLPNLAQGRIEGFFLASLNSRGGHADGGVEQAAGVGVGAFRVAGQYAAGGWGEQFPCGSWRSIVVTSGAFEPEASAPGVLFFAASIASISFCS